MHHQRDRIAVVLAAGKGTRMRSALPKPLHPVAGRPMLTWVFEAARSSGCRELVTVVGHGSDALRGAYRDTDDLRWVEQHPQRGTGHALAQAASALEGREALLLVLYGDVPLVSAGTLEALARAASAPDTWGAMAVAELDQPGALGRVLTAPDGSLDRIVEARDASREELAVRRVNAGIYALPAPKVFDDLEAIEPANAQGELYLTDALGLAVDDGRRVALVTLDDPAEAFGVNDRRDLGRAHRALLARQTDRLTTEGVTVLDPARTVVEPGVEIGTDTVLHPDVTLLGNCRIGQGCTLHQGAWLRDTTLEDDVEVAPYSVLEGATVASHARVGPFARLRPGATLDEDVRVGNFVEVKKSHLRKGVKAGHLAYLGDADVGAETNIGAGVVTCNYDGHAKHRTTIGERAFIGSDTMLVAPVTVGDRATTGAGSTINQSVPDDALAVGRSRQRTIPDWSERQAAIRARHQRQED